MQRRVVQGMNYLPDERARELEGVRRYVRIGPEVVLRLEAQIHVAGPVPDPFEPVHQ